MIKYLKYCWLLVFPFMMVVPSCKKKAEKSAADSIAGNYFSINQFMLDEWNTYAGQPFMIDKVVKTDEKTDSALTNSDVLDWGSIVKTFSETDISDRKYLGQYKFTQFDDNTDHTHNFFWEALDEELYTQKLLLTIDQFTSKVKGIYVETEKKDAFDDCVQKLYYAPLKTVQIQINDKPVLGSKKYTIITYNFRR